MTKMTPMKRLRILGGIFRETGANKIIWSFFIFIFICAIIILICEPEIDNYGDSLWYCYAVATTIGFGDFLSVTFIGRVISVILSIYAALVIAIVTGVVVKYYNDIIARKDKDTIVSFMDKLESLPEMSKEELQELSNRVSRFRKTGKIG